PLIDRALRVRQDLVALQRRIVANRRRIALADAQRIPNLIFSLKYGREEDANLIVAGIGLSLPFFQRNQGDRARVRALDQRLRASERRARLEIEREVVAAWLAQRAAQRRLAHYGNKIFTRFKAQLRLLEESFRAGKIGLPQVLLFQRQLLGSQRAIVEAKAALIRARIRLEQAVGGSLSLKTVRSK
ncbi:MAG: TolC family protein, partial [Myxococcales bacterium]|nr:TolC family protein [Myxococcales bacterium]